jgi:hypothetical protein
MAEVYIYRNDPVKTKIFYGGEIVDADSTVLVDIYDITEDPGLATPVDPLVPVLQNQLAIKSEVDYGTYTLNTPFSLTNRNRNLKYTWKYSVNGTSISHNSFVDVVTPYCSLAEAIEDLNLGTDSSDPMYKSYHELRMAEKYARKIIENYCGQSFYLYDDVQVAYGAGTEILPLPFKLNTLHELYADDILLVDNVSDPAVNNWGYVPMISETGFGIRTNQANMVDNTVYIANGMVPPSINDMGYSGPFRKDVRYRVQGKFGWEEVPDNIEEACIILMGEYFSKDSTWKNKYVQHVQSFDWQFEYFDDVFRGTGNLYVDQLLQPYVINGMMII